MAQDLSLRLPAAPALLAAVALRPLAWPLAIAALSISLLAWAAIAAAYNVARDQEAARLEALSDLRSTQAAGWLAEKLAQARFAGISPLGETFAKWRVEGDTAARDRLLVRLASFHRASGGHSVLVMDAGGEILASEPPQSTTVDPALRATAQRALETRTAQSTPFYGQQGAAPAPRIDVVMPLMQSGTPPRGLLVLRIDPRMLARIKRIARERYLNYQSMIKQWLSERMELEVKGR